MAEEIPGDSHVRIWFGCRHQADGISFEIRVQVYASWCNGVVDGIRVGGSERGESPRPGLFRLLGLRTDRLALFTGKRG